MSSSRLVAIDPGPEESGYVWIEDGVVTQFGKVPTDEVPFPAEGEFVIEMVASYGMPVGAEVFETVYWIGRLCERWEALGAPDADRVFRKDVKMHLCGDPRAKDSNIRQALIDRFGPGKEKAIGTKKNPGPLYGITGDVWQALALACYWIDTHA